NGAGIRIQNSTGDTIGGPDRGDRNLISTNRGVGIHLWTSADGNLIQNNLVGTDKTGTSKAGANGAQGIFIEGGSGNTVGGATANLRHVVSGNVLHGVDIALGNNNVIRGNYLGTDVSGNRPVGNGMNGVVVNSAKNTVVRNNVIAANGSASNADTGGILIGFRGTASDSDGTVVAGNHIGVGADGTTNPGNRNYGVVLHDPAVKPTIGCTAAPS